MNLYDFPGLMQIINCFQVLDTIRANTGDSGPWSVDYLRKNSLYSWKFDGSDDADLINVTFVEVNMLFFQISHKIWVSMLRLILFIFLPLLFKPNEKVSDMEREASKTKKENDPMALGLPARVKGLKENSVSGIIGWFSVCASFQVSIIKHSNVTF